MLKGDRRNASSAVQRWARRLRGGRLMKIKDEILETWAEFLESSDRNIRVFQEGVFQIATTSDVD